MPRCKVEGRELEAEVIRVEEEAVPRVTAVSRENSGGGEEEDAAEEGLLIVQTTTVLETQCPVHQKCS